MAGLLVSAENGVGLLRIDLPEQRNALSTELLEELIGVLSDFDLDPSVRCSVIAGSEEVFASGADIKAISRLSPIDIYEGRRARCWDGLRRIRKPTVAAVSGLCLGGGCELAMQMDIIVASDSARFGLPETALGLIPGAGGTQAMPRAIGKAKAMDVILAGRLLSAREAEEFGLVSRVADDGNWLELALEVANRIAERPEVAVRLAREAVLAGLEVGLRAGIDIERRAFAIAFGTADAREGLSAFIEKRQPRWEREAAGNGKQDETEENEG
jgi:enoyl-CoA hydratase